MATRSEKTLVIAPCFGDKRLLGSQEILVQNPRHDVFALSVRGPLMFAVLCAFLFASAVRQVPADEKKPPAKDAEEKKSDSSTAASPRQPVEDLAKNAKRSIVVVSTAGRDGKQQGLGTGFIISADGLIATNQHVIGEARPISVQMSDGKKYDVTEVHASDRGLDLAILRIDAKGLHPLALGDATRLKDGEPIVAIGNPHGLKHSVVAGVVSGRRTIEGRAMIQLAMPVEPGNSGGPVLDSQGQVCGVVTMKSAVTNNLGFAVEVNLLKPLMDKPNPIPMQRWLTIGTIDPREWTPLFGARWQQRAGRILVAGSGAGFGGRSLCLSTKDAPELPFELTVTVKLEDEAGAAGLAFHADGEDKHYGFYPTNGKLRLTCFDGPTVYQWRVLAETASPHYRSGDWNQLRVRIEKDRLLCYVNDQLTIESLDHTYSSGRVGLAKFRDTQAEFRRFEVGAKVGAAQLEPKQRATLEKLVDELPPLATLLPKQLKPLEEAGAASVDSIREKAKQLEKRAEELRRAANDLHVQQVTAELHKRIGADGNDFDLLRAALLIARLDDEEVNVDAYIAEVDRMAREVQDSLAKDADDTAKIAALNKYLFNDNGFHGARFEYYHRANSYLNRVIDDREGLPITLSVLYLELGERLKLNLAGVGLPGHFIVKHISSDKSEKETLIDVFEGGKTMSREEAAAKVREALNQELRDEHLHAAESRDILYRMLRNLLNVAQSASDKEAMLRYVDAMLVIQPDAVQERALRAVLRFDTGRRDAAVADLDWFLETQPEGADLDRIRQMREYFQSGKRQ